MSSLEIKWIVICTRGLRKSARLGLPIIKSCNTRITIDQKWTAADEKFDIRGSWFRRARGTRQRGTQTLTAGRETAAGPSPGRLPCATSACRSRRPTTAWHHRPAVNVASSRRGHSTPWDCAQSQQHHTRSRQVGCDKSHLQRSRRHISAQWLHAPRWHGPPTQRQSAARVKVLRPNRNTTAYVRDTVHRQSFNTILRKLNLNKRCQCKRHRRTKTPI